MDIQSAIEAALDSEVESIATLGGGCIGQVYDVLMPDGQRVVAKIDDSAHPTLDVEAAMLAYLRDYSDLPLPQVIYSSSQVLLLTRIKGNSVFSKAAEEHAAELLANLHKLTAPAYGFERPTLAGSLPQPNDWTESWIEFFGRYRLQHMALLAVAAGQISEEMASRIDRLVAELKRWLCEPCAPSLLHGDVWTTNVLANESQITGFIDPAIYYGSPEIELAFISLFDTFGRPFFERYNEISPIAPGFFEERRDIYNLYPLLIHSTLFGGGYAARVDSTLRRFGY